MITISNRRKNKIYNYLYKTALSVLILSVLLIIGTQIYLVNSLPPEEYDGPNPAAMLLWEQSISLAVSFRNRGLITLAIAFPLSALIFGIRKYDEYKREEYFEEELEEELNKILNRK